MICSAATPPTYERKRWSQSPHPNRLEQRRHAQEQQDREGKVLAMVHNALSCVGGSAIEDAAFGAETS